MASILKSQLSKISSRAILGIRAFSNSTLRTADFPSITDELPASKLDVAPEDIDIKERLASLIPSFEEIGTQQTTTTPYFETEEENSAYELTMAKMLASGLHLGSSTHHWNPRNLPFVFGSRADINIFNLEVTMSYLKRACGFTREVAYNGGIILFLSSKPQFASATIQAARRCNSYYVYHKWVPGTITNRESVLGSKAFLYHEGEQSQTKLFKPDLVIVANYQDNIKAIAEATRQNIPTIALIDSDQDPSGVTYPIPGNDDSVRGLDLVLGLLSTAAKDGMDKRAYIDRLKNQKAINKAKQESETRAYKPKEEVLFSKDA